MAGEGSDGGAAEHAHKRIKNSDEFSMKFLVDKFYGKVRCWRPGLSVLTSEGRQERRAEWAKQDNGRSGGPACTVVGSKS